MTGFVIIQWTSANIDEARVIARQLVEGKHVACANIIPVVESIYLWKGKVETDQEVKVFFKTREEKFDVVKEFIRNNASYEVSEILKINIDDANEEYLQWIKDVT